MSKLFSARMLLRLWLPFVMLAASCGAAFGAFTLARAAGDRVEILGSGDDVSILITTGRTELLIATGTDRTAFGNAYDRISIAPGSRPDILLVAGDGQSHNVPTSAIRLFPDAHTYAIHPLPAGPTTDSGLAQLSPIPRNPIRFTLDDRIVVVVESVTIDADEGTFAWRAVVTRETTRIAVVSAVEHADRFTWAEPVSALVVAANAGGPIDRPVDAAAIVGSAKTLDLPDDGGGTTVPGQGPAHIVPVRPGSVATLTFVRSGVEVTSDDRIYSTDQG